MRRRDLLIVQLAGQLADSRAREALLAERLSWYQAALPDMPAPVPAPLRLVQPQADARIPRSNARTARRSSAVIS